MKKHQKCLECGKKLKPFTDPFIDEEGYEWKKTTCSKCVHVWYELQGKMEN